jgi:hypothetical protein
MNCCTKTNEVSYSKRSWPHKFYLNNFNKATEYDDGAKF